MLLDGNRNNIIIVLFDVTALQTQRQRDSTTGVSVVNVVHCYSGVLLTASCGKVVVPLPSSSRMCSLHHRDVIVLLHSSSSSSSHSTVQCSESTCCWRYCSLFPVHWWTVAYRPINCCVLPLRLITWRTSSLFATEHRQHSSLHRHYHLLAQKWTV